MSYNDDWPRKRDGFRLFGWSVAGTVAAVALVCLAVVLAGVFTFAWAPWKGKIEERNQTVGSGTYRIASYEYYFDQCNTIKSDEQKIATYKAQLNVTPAPSPDQVTRLNAAIMAQTNLWIEHVNEYNSNADKERTKGQFRDDGLPEHIDPNNLTNGIETNCG